VSGSDSRRELLRGLRAGLSELAAEGVEVLERPTRSEPVPETPQATTSAVPGSMAEERASLLAQVRGDLGDCTRCPLHETRNEIVFGEGNPEAPVVFVGEGPGAEEDKTGRPFVGRAGELLGKIIESVGWQREDVYICNIVKCRPPGNRDPQPEEVATCKPYLERQIEAIQPLAIVTLGKPAASTLLGRNIAITKARGTWQEWNGIPLMPTFHPAYLLRNYTRETRMAVWDDLRAVRAHVEEARK